MRKILALYGVVSLRFNTVLVSAPVDAVVSSGS
jgi:uncharacterized membrane protein